MTPHNLWERWKSRPSHVNILGIDFACDNLTLKRLVKAFVNTTFCLIFCLIPEAVHAIGKAGYILTLFSVIVPPSKRLGQQVESIVITLIGMAIGLAFTNLTRYIASLPIRHLVYESEDELVDNSKYRAALGILALGEFLMLMSHGYIRSKIPRVFAGALTFFIVTHFAYLSTFEVTAKDVAINFGYPIMLACGTSLFFNLTIFPESGSTDLGKVTVKLIEELKETISLTANYFVNSAEVMRLHLEQVTVTSESDGGSVNEPLTIHGEPLENHKSHSSTPELDITELGTLLKKKTALAAKYTSSKAALTESTFEITYAYVSPTALKPMVKLLNGIVKSAGAMLDACELEFALLGKVQAAKLTQNEEERDIIQKIKPEREIVHGNKQLLLAMVQKVAEPISMLEKAMHEAFDHCIEVVSYALDDKQQMKDTPHKLDEFKDAIDSFDVVSRSALVSMDFGTVDDDHIDDYLLPRDELFLLSSFILNLKSAALSTLALLNEAQVLYETRRKRESIKTLPILGKKRLWSATFDNRRAFTKYFFWDRNDGENIEGHDVFQFTEKIEVREAEISRQLTNSSNKETVLPLTPEKSLYRRIHDSWVKAEIWMGTQLAQLIELSPSQEKHWKFALKVTLPMFLVSWPMFVPHMRSWYYDIRGAWVGFVVALVTETTLGGSVFIFILRTVGLTIGSAWAVLAHTAGHGHTHSIMGVVQTILFIPSLWVMLGTKYIKGGMITIVSANVVLLATLYPTTPGGIVTNFAKRTLAMMIGGAVALVCQLLLFPVKAREELVVVTVQAIRECSRMERIIAYGFDDPAAAQKEFKKCAKVARGALTAAATLRTFTSKEPRLKGPYEEISKIFGEIIFVTRQIIDRLENIVFLRQQYGSVILDEYGPEVLAYRRQTAAAITTTLRAVEAALLNKTPLPQYLPSARLAHRRFVNRVREVMITRLSRNSHYNGVPNIGTPGGTPGVTPHRTPLGTPLGTPKERPSLPTVTTESRNGESRESESREDSKGDTSKPSFSLFQHADEHSEDDSDSDSTTSRPIEIQPALNLSHRTTVLQQKFMSWSATSSAVEEVIEYVEELADLTVLLVGANKFKYGFLSRPIYADWAASAARAYDEVLSSPDPLKTEDDHEFTLHEEPTAKDDTPGVLDPKHIPQGLIKRVFSMVEPGGVATSYGMAPEMEKVERIQSLTVQRTTSSSSVPLTRRESIRSVINAVGDEEPERKFLTLRRLMGRKISKK